MNIRPKKDSQGRYYIRPYMGMGNRPYKLLEETPGTLSLQDAKKAAEAFVESLKAPLVTAGELPNLTAVFHTYLKVNSAMSEKSQWTAKHYLKRFIAFLTDKAVESITPMELEGYKAHRLVEKAANATINREISILVAATNECFRLGLIKTNPLAGRVVKRLKANRRLDYFERDEWEAFISVYYQRDMLLNHIKDNNRIRYSPLWREDYLFNMNRMADIYRVLLLTCSRLSEVLTLRWVGGVNFKTGKVNVHMGKRDRDKLPQDMTPELRAILERLYAETPDKAGYVFTRYDKQPFSTDTVERAFTAGLLMSGITRHMTPHHIRHTACSWMAIAGVPLHTIAAVAGHKNIASTMIYAHLSPSSLNPALNVLTTTQGKPSNETASGTALSVVKS